MCENMILTLRMQYAMNMTRINQLSKKHCKKPQVNDVTDVRMHKALLEFYITIT